MTWVRLDDRMPDHMKWEGLSDAAFRLGIRIVCRCRAQNNGGRITREALVQMAGGGRRAKRLIAELVNAGRGVHEQGILEERKDCFIVHDYDEFQPGDDEAKSRKQEISAKRSEAGRKGAQKRWHPDATDPPKQTDGNCHPPQRQLDNPIPIPIGNIPTTTTTSKDGSAVANPGANDRGGEVVGSHSEVSPETLAQVAKVLADGMGVTTPRLGPPDRDATTRRLLDLLGEFSVEEITRAATTFKKNNFFKGKHSIAVVSPTVLRTHIDQHAQADEEDEWQN